MTLSQQRAKRALEQVLSVAGTSFEASYYSYVRGLAENIHRGGLGQVLATLNSRRGQSSAREQAYEALNAHLLAWLSQQLPENPFGSGIGAAATKEASKRDYLEAHAEALEYLTYLKMFAQAYLSNEPSQGESRG